MLEKIDVKQIDNAIKAIGDDWMLITAWDEDNQRVNAMTASWGALGVLWHRPICICFVRPERHTFKLLGEKKELSISFLDNNRRDAYMVCGRESGADIDKLAKCGLSTERLDEIDVIAESQTALTCRVLYEDDLKKSCFLDASVLKNYETAGYHRVFICEIIGAYQRASK